ncbi:MAG: hypothetical protein AAGF13_01750 [Pseudomonadota bacterium]
METPDELKQRLFKEVHAMVSYIADRGIDKELPDASLLGALDLEPEDRAALPIGDVMALHSALARIVSPAMPETIEKLHEYRTREDGLWWLRRLAPLNSILWLIIASIVLVAAFGFGLSQRSHADLPPGYAEMQDAIFDKALSNPGDNDGAAGGLQPLTTPAAASGAQDESAEEVRIPYFLPVIQYLSSSCRFSVDELAQISEGIDEQATKFEFDAAVREHLSACQDLRQPILLRFFLFFGALGMLGAAYSSIYDSFSYIREGRYDLRLASTYYVRIFLGGFSGVLLAEPLSGFLEQGVLSSALLAFIGGFSAQLVYDLLTKLVDSVANMFRADRRKERQSIQAQAEFGAFGAIQQNDATQRQNLAVIVADAQKVADPAERAELMQDSLLDLMSKGGKPATATVVQSPLIEHIRRATSFAEVSALVAPLLPDSDPEMSAKANAALADLHAALDIVGKGSSKPDELASARAAIDRGSASDLVTGNLGAALSDLGGALAGQSLRGIVKGALAASQHLTDVAVQRWRHVAYGATKPTLALLQDAGTGAMLDAWVPPGAAEISAADLLSGDPATLFDRLGGSSDPEAFEASLEGWIDASVRRLLAEDWTSSLAPAVGSDVGGEPFVQALARVAASDAARGGLQKLELLGGAASKTTDPANTLLRLLAQVDVTLTDEVE